MVRLIRLVSILGIVLVSLGATAPTAVAHEAIPYQEEIMVGPYPMVVWVSDWPIAAERSVDFTFSPEGGIADKTAEFRLIMPDGEVYRDRPLPRHPRNRSVWGIDLIALPTEGPWLLELTVSGPEGTGHGTFGPMHLIKAPGPPPAVSWAIGLLPPLLLLTGLAVAAWRRFPPSTRRLAWSWRDDAADPALPA
jgi:hypothetical protein